MKYEIIEEFLTLGYNVLLSDVDIVIVQDPLEHLYRDHDVEGMSDGFDDATAYGEIYGIDDESMGWSRYAQGFRHMAMNSGLFFLRANSRTIDLMQRIADRLHKEKAWDQSVYNEEIFGLSHGDKKSPQVTVRVMDRMQFMNSKTLFKIVRHMPKDQQPKPVMVHMNYHPNKEERMKGAIKYYWKGDLKGLDAFPGGSEPGS
jgi:arabinosyltransferase